LRLLILALREALGGHPYGYQNDSLGPHCKRCADRAIKQAQRQKRMMPDMVQPG
jgi:hypothetical protein